MKGNWPLNQWNPCPIIKCPTNQHCQHHKSFIFGAGGLNFSLILWTIFPFHLQRLADECFASWRSLACWGNCQVLVFFLKVKNARPHYWAKKNKKIKVCLMFSFWYSGIDMINHKPLKIVQKYFLFKSWQIAVTNCRPIPTQIDASFHSCPF